MNHDCWSLVMGKSKTLPLFFPTLITPHLKRKRYEKIKSSIFQNGILIWGIEFLVGGLRDYMQDQKEIKSFFVTSAFGFLFLLSHLTAFGKIRPKVNQLKENTIILRKPSRVPLCRSQRRNHFLFFDSTPCVTFFPFPPLCS